MVFHASSLNGFYCATQICIARTSYGNVAFRPTGSPAAALITLLHHITHLLTTNPYVIVICVDFSKAFETVRHSNLLHEMAQLYLPDEVYWLVHGHTHSTQYLGVESSVLGITANIIQGSAIGPASFVVGAAELKAVTPGNLLVKFADDKNSGVGSNLQVGAECRREAPAENFLMCSLTF